MAKKAFSKGEAVTLVQNWDSKGTISIRHAVVYSCGTKQMILTDAVTGDEIGRHFKPFRATATDFGDIRVLVATFPKMSAEDAERVGFILAEKFLGEQRAFYARCIASHGASAGYVQAIEREIALLHEPRVIDRTGTTIKGV